MNRSMLARTLVALAGCATAVVVPATAATAANGNPLYATVTCENGVTFTANVVSVGSFHEEITAGNFQLKYAAFDNVVIRDSLKGVSNNQDLVTCFYTGPNTGHEYTIIGFFTPAS